MVEYLFKITQLVSGGTNSGLYLGTSVPESVFFTTVPLCHSNSEILKTKDGLWLRRWCAVRCTMTLLLISGVMSILLTSLVPAPFSAEDCCPAV